MPAAAFTPQTDPAVPAARSRWFWFLLGLVVAAQLAAFWSLCSQQVRKAHSRDSEMSARRVALADCLQTVPRSTFASCSATSTLAEAPFPSVSGQAPITNVSFQAR